MKLLLKTTNIYFSDSDFELINQYKWYVAKSKNKLYVKTCIYNGDTKQTLYLHNLLLGGSKKGFTVLFKDGNTLNCQRENISLIPNGFKTHIKLNVVPHKSSQYLGVFKRGNKFIAQICFQKRRVHLGYFNSEKEAAEEYNKFSLQYYGIYAKTN